MTSISEVGHAKNVANFEDLIAYCTAYGSTYNPSKISLQLLSLNDLHTTAQTEISNVITSKNTFDTATGDRQLTFEPLKPLATKIFNYLSVTDASVQIIADAKTINNRIQGKRAGSVNTNPSPEEGGESQTNTVSVSRQSYDSLTENFAALVDLVSSVESYIPNETELTTISLNNYLI